MRIYLAARWSRREEMEAFKDHLEEDPRISVHARWVTDPSHRVDVSSNPREGQAFNERLAREDLEDIDGSDALVYFHPHGGRGGALVEMGYALARGKVVYWVGEPGNVFSYLPEVRGFTDLDEAVEDIRIMAERLDPVHAAFPPGHIVEFKVDDWGLQHPVACRPDLTECPVHLELKAMVATIKAPPVEPGRYAVMPGEGGRLEFERI